MNIIFTDNHENNNVYTFVQSIILHAHSSWWNLWFPLL